VKGTPQTVFQCLTLFVVSSPKLLGLCNALHVNGVWLL
jgi:hypothetical protein